MTNRLYTFVLDYRRGTYIGQAPGDSVTTALSQWISRIRSEEIAKWGLTQDELSEIARTDEPVAVEGCINAWCLSGSTNGGLVLINAIATDQS